MQSLKETHDRIKAKQKEQKEINNILRDMLTQSKSYQETLEKKKELEVKLKQIKNALYADCKAEMEKKERLNMDVKSDKVMMNDIALTQLMKGQTVELTDDNGVKYEPVFKVAFKKAN